VEKNGVRMEHKSGNISETRKDREKGTISNGTIPDDENRVIIA